MTQLQLFREQPTCPGCGSSNVTTENATAGKCQRCGWRCRIGADGTARSLLDIFKTGTLQARRRKRGADG